MNKVICITALSVTLAFISGCDRGSRSGGGTRSFTVGTKTTTAVYGWSGPANKLGFVIFSDLDTPNNTVGSASSKWTGYIEYQEGPTVHYKHTSGGMDINGTHYEFAKGRVFLVSVKEGSLSVRQVDIPIRDIAYDVEINRIAKMEDVQEFLGK